MSLVGALIVTALTAICDVAEGVAPGQSLSTRILVFAAINAIGLGVAAIGFWSWEQGS